MFPVEVEPLKVTASGAIPLVGLAVTAACNGSTAPLGLVKAKGAEWGLSVPLLKAAVNVKLVVSAVRDTRQSIDVALALCV